MNPPKFADALAPEPPPPEILTVGELVYPLPLFVIVILLTFPASSVASLPNLAVAVAPEPPPPEMVTLGVDS